MSSYTRPQTLSQALLNLGRIQKIEDPITFGLLGLYKAREYHRIQKGERVKIKLHLERLEEFCDRFEIIVLLEQKKDFDSLESWLVERTPKKEITSRIDTLLGIYSLFSSEDERLEQLDNFKALRKTVKHILKGNIDPHDIKTSLEKLETLREMFTRKLETEKRISEKIISGRTPSI